MSVTQMKTLVGHFYKVCFFQVTKRYKGRQNTLEGHTLAMSVVN